MALCPTFTLITESRPNRSHTFISGVAIFDFDETGYGAAASDVARATRALHGEEGADLEPTLYGEFLIGYRAEREFTEEEEAAVEAYLLDRSEPLAPWKSSSRYP